MDLSWRKNETIVSNIANAETPQYRAVKLDFGSELDRAFGGHGTEELVRTDTQTSKCPRSRKMEATTPTPRS
jgi:flagellar basal-body rod protein FlgB